MRNGVMYEIRTNPSVPGQMVATITTLADDDWRKPIFEFLRFGTTLGKIDTVKKRAVRFLIIDDGLFEKGYNTLYLKCLGPMEANDTLREIHEGVCRNHIGSRTLAHKALRQRYYWPTMKQDSQDLVKKCEKCQQFSRTIPENLCSILSPWPFV